MANKIALCFGLEAPAAKREPYLAAVRTAGIGFEENPRTLDGLAGLMLTGGTDVDPALYGEVREAQTEEPDAERDHHELALLREALDRDLPVLAICRGLQVMNVCLGGTLRQHIDGHRVPGELNAHDVQIREQTTLATILGGGRYCVNSRHHQCVGRVGKGLVVSAKAGDIVEALEVPERGFFVAVQWHPEDRIDGGDGKLFEAFARAVQSVTAAAPA